MDKKIQYVMQQANVSGSIKNLRGSQFVKVSKTGRLGTKKMH